MRRRASTCDSWPGEGENAATAICLRLRRAAARGESQTSCGCWTRGSSRPALRAVTAARSDGYRALRRIHRPSVRVRGDLNSRFRENTDGHTRAPDLAIDLPAPASRPSADSIRVRPDSPAAASPITSRAALPPVHLWPLNSAAPPRRECARRGLDPIPPPNREDRTMTETVDRAPAPRYRTLCSAPLGGRRVMDFGEVICFGVPLRPEFWIGPWTTGEGSARRISRSRCPAGLPCGHCSPQRSALMPKCSMSHASGPITAQAVTARSCVTPAATTSKRFAAPLGSGRRRACRRLPLPATVRLLQV